MRPASIERAAAEPRSTRHTIDRQILINSPCGSNGNHPPIVLQPRENCAPIRVPPPAHGQSFTQKKKRVSHSLGPHRPGFHRRCPGIGSTRRSCCESHCLTPSPFRTRSVSARRNVAKKPWMEDVVPQKVLFFDTTAGCRQAHTARPLANSSNSVRWYVAWRCFLSRSKITS